MTVVNTPGQVVLVTGAGSGMGLETALLLASRGHIVYGSVLSDEEAATLGARAGGLGLSLPAIRMDVCRDEQIDAAVRRVIEEQGRLDALVHFAALGLRGFFEDLGMDEVRRVFDVNVFGAMRLLQAVLPHMRASNRGRILITTSVAGRIGSMSISGYAASKFAMEGLVECLAQEVAPFGIHVSLLEPGLVMTERFTRTRNRARRAVDPQGPYYRWFCQHEKIVDDLLARQTLTAQDAARTVERILQAQRPRLRYVIGTRARLIVSLRRHVPGELFERLYFGWIRRMVTRPRDPAKGLS